MNLYVALGIVPTLPSYCMTCTTCINCCTMPWKMWNQPHMHPTIPATYHTCCMNFLGFMPSCLGMCTLSLGNLPLALGNAPFLGKYPLPWEMHPFCFLFSLLLSSSTLTCHIKSIFLFLASFTSIFATS